MINIIIENRILIGVTIFLLLGAFDILKNRDNPKRAKEYGYLFSLALISTLFAIIHDLITFNISVEYFEVAKGLGANISFYPEVLTLAVKASYWVGIVIGVVFIIVNNPKEGIPQLPYIELYKKLIFPLVGALIFALIMAISSPYLPAYFSKGGEGILKDLMNFNRVAYIHWGTYLGGFAGALVGVRKLYLLRKV